MTPNRSGLMTAYNVARGMVPDGRRLNRAFGIAQRRRLPDYVTTPQTCTCPDWKYRQGPKGQRCKHQLALALAAAAA